MNKDVTMLDSLCCKALAPSLVLAYNLESIDKSFLQRDMGHIERRRSLCMRLGVCTMGKYSGTEVEGVKLTVN